jgi:hypothetical protein
MPRLPKPVVNVSKRNNAQLIYTTAPRRKIAEAAVKLAKDVPPPPKRLDETLVKAARTPMRINLHPDSATSRIGRDTGTVAKRVLAGESVKHQPKFRLLIGKLTDKHWTEVLLKLRHRFNDLLAVRVVAVKGLLFELWLRQMPKFDELLARCGRKLLRVGGWHEEAFVVRAARTLDDRREVADYLIVAFDRLDDPQRMWVLAIVESKSEHNAISIVRHESAAAVNALGKDAELLGQPRQSLHRIKHTGVDLTNAVIEGKSQVKNLRPFKGEQIRIGTEGVALEYQTTELVGVVPTDAPASVLRRIERDSRKQRTEVWFHETTGMETNFVAYEVIQAFEE